MMVSAAISIRSVTGGGETDLDRRIDPTHHEGREVRIHAREQLGQSLDHRDLAAKAMEHAGDLEADIAASDHREPPGERADRRVQGEEIRARHTQLCSRDRRDEHVGSGRDDDLVCMEDLRGALGGHLDGVGVEEATGPLHQA